MTFFQVRCRTPEDWVSKRTDKAQGFFSQHHFYGEAMKHLYVNSRLHSLQVAMPQTPRQWLFSQGEPWLLLTPPRLRRLAWLLGLEDRRVSSLFRLVRRWHPHPELYCRELGVREVRQMSPEEYPPAICPRCDSVHSPHPEDADQPCEACRKGQANRRSFVPRKKEEKIQSESTRSRILENDPGAFLDGVLSPHWRINRKRHLERDWDSAVNRVLLGASYRRVAKEFDCSVGLLHRKVKERGYWENN